MLSEVAQRVRGYPRALEALYAVLRNDRNTSLDELLGKATETLPEKVVEVMVGEAFSRLDRHEKLILQALAIFNRPVPAVALDYLLQPFVPAIESVSVLRWLVNLQIVRKDRDRYYLHPVDSEFALAQVLDEASLPTGSLGTTAMTRKALFGRAAEYFREIRKPKTEWDSIQDLEPQLAEFDLLCRSEQYDEAAALLLAIGFNYLRSWGHVGMLLELHEQLRGHVTDQRTEVHCLGVLGTVYWDTGNLSQAVTDLRNCIELTAQTSGANAGAAWWCDLGCCLRDMGRIDEALVAHEKALQIDHYTGDGSGMEIDIQNSAECYADKGLIALAIRAVRLSLEAIPIVDPHDVPHAMAFRLATLAACTLWLGYRSGWPLLGSLQVKRGRIRQCGGSSHAVP
jgi:tetratricopeptide (TPR) repeat protein